MLVTVKKVRAEFGSSGSSVDEQACIAKRECLVCVIVVSYSFCILSSYFFSPHTLDARYTQAHAMLRVILV
eukprot:1377730-Prymnesium_polylepis.1